MKGQSEGLRLWWAHEGIDSKERIVFRMHNNNEEA